MKIAPFFAGTYEVTNEQYKAFVDATNRRPPSTGSATPSVRRSGTSREQGLKAKQARGGQELQAPRVGRAREGPVGRGQLADRAVVDPGGHEQHGVSYVDFATLAPTPSGRAPAPDRGRVGLRGPRCSATGVPLGRRVERRRAGPHSRAALGRLPPRGFLPRGQEPFGSSISQAVSGSGPPAPTPRSRASRRTSTRSSRRASASR